MIKTILFALIKGWRVGRLPNGGWMLAKGAFSVSFGKTVVSGKHQGRALVLDWTSKKTNRKRIT